MAPVVDPRKKAEKGLSSMSTPGDRFAYWLSQITSPFVVGPGFLVCSCLLGVSGGESKRGS